MNKPVPGQDHKLRYLGQIDLLQHLAPEDLRAVDQMVPLLAYPAGTVLYEPGQDLNRLYFLKRGRVRLYRLSPDGRQLTLAILKDGNIFGETDSFATGAGSCYAETLTDTLVCTMTTADLARFMQQRPSVALKLVEILSRELRRAQELVATLVLEDVRGRVLYCLSRLAAEFGAPDGDWAALDLKLTQEELAHMIGATRESVSAILAELSRHGLVRTGRGRIAVRRDVVATLPASDGDARGAAKARNRPSG
ncbi:MAG: Crp/Fnr family transcriptional regulator [Actinomycetia bacterium]|nr:Crp/Fnr family transcriptional regulator [Actinomycetes bacterium]